MSGKRQPFIHSIVQQDTNVTHRPTLIASPILAFQHVAMNLRDHRLGGRNVPIGLRNDRVGSHDVVTNVRDGPMCTSWRWRQQFSRCTGYKYQISDLPLVEIADLA